jgi:hypothetical protein
LWKTRASSGNEEASPETWSRTLREITPAGEEATKKYLELMRTLADRSLGSTEAANPTTA